MLLKGVKKFVRYKRDLISDERMALIDAAYAEFAAGDWTEPVETHHNLIILRTLSKAFGLAGARVGYAMAHPDLIAAIDGVRPPGSISSVSVTRGSA